MFPDCSLCSRLWELAGYAGTGCAGTGCTGTGCTGTKYQINVMLYNLACWLGTGTGRLLPHNRWQIPQSNATPYIHIIFKAMLVALVSCHKVLASTILQNPCWPRSTYSTTQLFTVLIDNDIHLPVGTGVQSALWWSTVRRPAVAYLTKRRKTKRTQPVLPGIRGFQMDREIRHRPFPKSTPRQETNEWMNERTNERMNEWTNEWMNERMNELPNERTNEWMNEWMNEWINERTNEWTNERTNGWNEWMNDRTNEWMNERTNEWTNEWINERMNE
jgi:hypothetical protein